MSYTKKDFALRLRQQLFSGYDVVEIARWAYQEFLNHSQELAPGLKTEIMKLVAMEEGPEFEMTEQEIYKMADELERSEE